MSKPVRALLALIAIAAGALAISQSQAPSVDASLTDEAVGRPAPEFNLPRLGDGEIRSLADYQAEVTVIDFWATHCAPCRRSIPFVERLGQQYEGVELVSINVDFPDPARDEMVSAFVRAQSMEADVLIDNGRTGYLYGAQRIPLLVMVDRHGVIRRVYHGFTEYSVLADGVESILGT